MSDDQCNFKEKADEVLNRNKVLYYIAGVLTAFLFAAITYAVMLLLPAEVLWFDPERVVVEDSEEGTDAPAMGYEREIKTNADIYYVVTVRRLPGLTQVCNHRSGTFEYKKNATLPAAE